MENINEKSSATLTITFKDSSNNLVTPVSGTYQIDAVPGGSIRTPTSFTPVSSTYDILLTPDDNKILNTTKTKEVHMVTVTVDLGGGDQSTAIYRYYVTNFKYIS